MLLGHSIYNSASVADDYGVCSVAGSNSCSKLSDFTDNSKVITMLPVLSYHVVFVAIKTNDDTSGFNSSGTIYRWTFGNDIEASNRKLIMIQIIGMLLMIRIKVV